jgi:hypothetical protein
MPATGGGGGSRLPFALAAIGAALLGVRPLRRRSSRPGVGDLVLGSANGGQTQIFQL